MHIFVMMAAVIVIAGFLRGWIESKDSDWAFERVFGGPSHYAMLFIYYLLALDHAWVDGMRHRDAVEEVLIFGTIMTLMWVGGLLLSSSFWYVSFRLWRKSRQRRPVALGKHA